MAKSRPRLQKAPHPAEHMSLMDQDKVESYNIQAVRIYTDGSKIEGKVGAALSIWNNEAEIGAHKMTLSPHCTVYQAELLAICKVSGLILKRLEVSFGIYSDSRLALESVTSLGSLHPPTVETRKNIKSIKLQNKEISLFWVKAHVGFGGE